MKSESENLEDYLVSNDVIDWKTPEIIVTANEIVSSHISDIEKTKALFEWVRDKIPHSKDINSDIVTCTASEVLFKGTGICYSKSHLLAALLRSQQIPAGFCYQVLRRDPPSQGTALHGLNGIFLPSIKKWLRVDPRGNTGMCNAQFDIAEEKLAFPMDHDAGEFIYETIFVNPSPIVLDILRAYDNTSEMLPLLPKFLNSGM